MAELYPLVSYGVEVQRFLRQKALFYLGRRRQSVAQMRKTLGLNPKSAVAGATRRCRNSRSWSGEGGQRRASQAYLARLYADLKEKEIALDMLD